MNPWDGNVWDEGGGGGFSNRDPWPNPILDSGVGGGGFGNSHGHGGGSSDAFYSRNFREDGAIGGSPLFNPRVNEKAKIISRRPWNLSQEDVQVGV